MTEALEQGIGQRIAGYRKVAGLKTAKDLADAIPNPKVTASVIQNIESGRKSDISVSQLLDISKALGISPLFLIVRIGSPFAKVDLANVGDDVANMTSAEVDRWFSESEPAETEHAALATGMLRRLREMGRDVTTYRAMMRVDRKKLSVFKYQTEHDDGTEYMATHDEVEAHDMIMSQLAGSIALNAKFLSYTSADLSWARDVIDHVRRASDPRGRSDG